MPLLLRGTGLDGMLPFPLETRGALLTSLTRLRPNISGPRVMASLSAWSESSPKSSSRLTLNPPFLNESSASADSAVAEKFTKKKVQVTSWEGYLGGKEPFNSVR